MPYSAYVIDEVSRKLILDVFLPQFPEVVAHHVTHRFPDQEPPPIVHNFEVVGYASNHRLECLIVRLDGLLDRPGGGVYHITLSIDREQGAKPVQSNQVIQVGWTPLDEPITITAQPKLLGHFKKPKKQQESFEDTVSPKPGSLEADR